jgi:6,7-dimethyl-8-ribityllumazine synthase
MNVLAGKLDASGMRAAIVVARFNDFVAQRLLEGAIDALVRHGASADDITVHWVPGSFEIPFAAQEVATAGGVDMIICLGVVIRGETPHFDYLSRECTAGIARAGERLGLPVAYGVLTCDTAEQAEERAGGKAGNKGWEAALAALEMADLYARLRS